MIPIRPTRIVPGRAARASLLAVAVLFSASASAQSKLPLPKGPKHGIRLDSSPQQAAIYIDSKEYGIQGYTPTTLRLPKGNYSITLELPGYKPYQTDITVVHSEAFTVTLERAIAPAIIDLRTASDQTSAGASITVDGQTVGTLPNQVEVAPGNHLVEIKKPEFRDDRQQVQVAEGERRTLVITLVPVPKPGSILVTSDVDGAEILVDGVSRDTTPAAIGDLVEGSHTVEVRKEGMPPWKQVVIVVAGKQVKVTASIKPAPPPVAAAPPPPPTPVAPPPPTSGSIKVLSSTPLADVFVDGEAKGPANLEIRDIRPGGHIVEVRAPNYPPSRVEVQVGAGEVKVVQVDLQAAAAQRPSVGSLRVISPTPDVEVFVDGAPVGRAPVVRNDLAPGKHYIVARKPGYAEYKSEIDVDPSRPVEIAVDLHASGSLRVLSNVPGTSVFLDGNQVGVTPLTLPDVGVGEHLVELRMKGYLDARQAVRVEGGSQKIVQADLAQIQTGPTVADLERAHRMQSSFSATTLDRGWINFDVGGGYPYFLGVRLIVGAGELLKKGPLDLGLDFGIEVRSNVYFTEAGLRPRLQIIKADPFALGFDLGFFGGGGPAKRNTFTFEMGPIITLLGGSWVHINLRPYLSVSTDQLCPTVGDIQTDDAQTGRTMTDPKTGMPVAIHGSGNLYSHDESNVCQVFDSKRTDYTLTSTRLGTTAMPVVFPSFGQPDPRARFLTTRFFLQASVEVALGLHANLWFMIEVDPALDQRQAFTAKFDSVFPQIDTPVYGQAGITAKF